MLKHLRTLIVVGQALLFSSAHANYQQLVEFEISAYRMSTTFAAFVFFEGSDKYKTQVASSRRQGQKLLNQLQTQYPQLTSAWQASASYIADKEQVVFDGTDQRLMIGLNIHTNELHRTINQLKTAHVKNKVQLNSITHLELELEKIMALYMASISSNMSTLHTDKSIEQLISDFSTKLDRLDKQPQVKKLMQKWNFIKGRINNNTEAAAPFITLYTTGQIRKIFNNLKPAQTFVVSDEQ